MKEKRAQMSKKVKAQLPRDKVFELFGLLAQLDKLPAIPETRVPFKFSYALAVNFSALEPIAKAIAKSAQTDPEFSAYLKEEADLNIQHAEKDERGKPKRTERGGFSIKDPSAYSEAFVALREQRKDAIARREAFLAEEIEVELYQAPGELVPEFLTPNAVRVLLPMIAEPDESSVRALRIVPEEVSK